MYKCTGRGKSSDVKYRLLMIGTIPCTNNKAGRVENKRRKFHCLADKLDDLSKKLDDSQSKNMEAKAKRYGVSLTGDLIGVGGILAAPFSGGASLLLTGASAIVSVGGGIGAYCAQNDLESETSKIMKEVDKCVEDVKQAQQELEGCFQDFEALLQFVRDSGAVHIMNFMETLEKKSDKTVWKQECEKAKPLFDCCTDAARFLSVLNSQGTKHILHRVFTIRFLFRKSQVLLKYVPEAVFSRAALTLHSRFTILAPLNMITKTGDQTVKITANIGKQVIQKTQPVGRNIVIQSKEMRVFGTIQKRTATVIKKAGTVSKVGLGLSALSIAIDTYCAFKAGTDSKKHHTEYKKVHDLAEEIRSWIQKLQAQIEEFKKNHDDMRMLHNELYSILVEMESGRYTFNRQELDMVSDEDGNILTYLERSDQLLR